MQTRSYHRTPNPILTVNFEQWQLTCRFIINPVILEAHWMSYASGTE